MNSLAWHRQYRRVTTAEYLKFLEGRPHGERWQLIHGVAVMMNPPKIRHQRISQPFCQLLIEALRTVRPDLSALTEIGINVPGVQDFLPEPGVAVVPKSFDDITFADQFFLIAEVLSESNRPDRIEEKRQGYIAHPDNRYVLIFQQDEMKVDVWSRSAGWTMTTLHDNDVLDLPEFGFRHAVREVYRDTPLANTAP
jgi:Uma2 family endonuclease